MDWLMSTDQLLVFGTDGFENLMAKFERYAESLHEELSALKMRLRHTRPKLFIVLGKWLNPNETIHGPS